MKLTCRRFGLARLMTAGALAYAIGCVVSALAPAMPVLLVGRFAQGFGGGALVAASFVAVPRLFAARLQPRVMALVSVAWLISAVSGPFVGGLFAASATGWRGGFWFLAIQAICLAIWLALRVRTDRTPENPPPSAREGIAGRLLLLAAGITLVALASADGSSVGGSLVAASSGVCLLALFLQRDAASVSSRLLPGKPLSLGTRAGAVVVTVLRFSASTGTLTLYGPLLATRLLGVSELQMGLVLVLWAIGWTGASTLLSGQPYRRDPLVILAGLGSVLVSIALLAWLLPRGPLGGVALASALQGAGFGAAWTFLIRRATAGATPEEAARIAGAIPTVQRVGYALGAAGLGIVANRTGLSEALGSPQREDLVAVTRAVFLWCVPVALVGFVAAVSLVRVPGERAEAPAA